VTVEPGVEWTHERDDARVGAPRDDARRCERADELVAERPGEMVFALGPVAAGLGERSVLCAGSREIDATGTQRRFAHGC
jgi:hypothetical protein